MNMKTKNKSVRAQRYTWAVKNVQINHFRNKDLYHTRKEARVEAKNCNDILGEKAYQPIKIFIGEVGKA